MTAEQYVNSIVKKIKCSGNKKKEIARQLRSEIDAELENGETLDVVLARMGSPEEIAVEFNQNMPERERKKYVRAKRFKICGVIAGILLVVILIAAAVLKWTTPKVSDVAEGGIFQKEAVESQAKKIVDDLNAGDYDTLTAESIPEMASVTTKETMDSARKQVCDDWGAFEKFGTVYMAEVEQQGKAYAVVELSAVYENISVTYTITFDEDMKLAGLYMK